MRLQISFDKEMHPQRLARVLKFKVNNGQALNRNNRRWSCLVGHW